MNQGWSGPGNPLNPSRRPGIHGGLGLTKPILVARKKNTYGVGKKTTHDHTNQWWLRGFEAALRGIGTDGNSTQTSEESIPTTPTSELYKFFVRGQGLAGTIKPSESNQNLQSSKQDRITPTSSVENGTSNQKKKRKREDIEGSPTTNLSQEKKKKKKKDKKAELCVDEVRVSSGIATPPDEEDSKGKTVSAEPAKDDILEKRRRKEEKREKKREKKKRKEMNLETEPNTQSLTSDHISSEECSMKKGQEVEKATKKAKLEKKREKREKKEGKEKKSKKSKKDKLRSGD
ncbi:conserved hypothetical protein [Microsporum canis CBS 113480]|uniref:Protein TMA23 n=1 Tax=Arthroderma otae (strain ATCC MYA-4605 / CBS 113480) TaxID=554155 RepID=C5FCL1_ARTOC|nr:conserved hypothetical protein [Microsporum canis CBS 113480]EEQ27545.1 conserved hypothetical protein [Microsporum canis CBS 113480]